MEEHIVNNLICFLIAYLHMIWKICSEKIYFRYQVWLNP